MNVKYLDLLAQLYVETVTIEQANHVMMVTIPILMAALSNARLSQDGHASIMLIQKTHVTFSVVTAL